MQKKRLEQMKKQLKERGAIYMSKVIRKRVSALLMSAVMATSSVAVASGSFMVANAAEGETVNIGKTLATSIPNPDDKDNPLNAISVPIWSNPRQMIILHLLTQRVSRRRIFTVTVLPLCSLI